MNSRAKFGTVALTAATVFTIPPAFGAAGPDNPVSDLPIYPTNRGSAYLGVDGIQPSPFLWYVTDSLKCEATGPGIPLPSNPAAGRTGDADAWRSDFQGMEWSQSTPEYLGQSQQILLSTGAHSFVGEDGRFQPSGIAIADFFAYMGYLQNLSSQSDFSARASYSEEFRAPSVSELFPVDTPDARATSTAIGANGDAGGVGSSPRSLTLGTMNRFILDDANRWLYPQTITRYGNLFYAELFGDRETRVAIAGDPDKTGLGWEPQVQFKLLPTGDFGGGSFPGVGLQYRDVGADAGPLGGAIGGEPIDAANLGAFLRTGAALFGMPALQDPAFDSLGQSLSLRHFDYGSFNVETSNNSTDFNLGPFVTQRMTFGNTTFASVTFPEVHRGVVIDRIVDLAITEYQVNGCRVILVPTDPNFQRTGRHGGGSWGQPEDDQWAIKRVGFTADGTSAWNQVSDDASPVVVAVIDTGLDWHHLDISPDNIWKNEDEIPDNGIDDDNNGYVDDVIGWDFFGKHNRPWDFDGHGTVVAGIIAATQDNDVGIAGINPHAKIMVLKGVNNFGNTRASFLAEAIVYAADNGAQIINLSVGGPHTNRMEQAAINYAHEKGVLIVAASGNDGIELDDFGPGGNDNVLTVGATYFDDRAAGFSNYGERVDLVAPGVDVLSLRARYTDTNFRPANAEYVLGTNYVGEDKRYIHVSGTSFSTPIVAATASLLMSKDPQLTASDVQRILLETAEDIEFPGKDKYAGHGMLDARAALSVDSDIRVVADISGVELVQTEDAEFIKVVGTIDATAMKRAWMQIGPGENPGGYKYVGQKRKYPIREGTLGTIPVRDFAGSDLWQIVINVEDRSGVVRRDAYPVRIN